MYMLCTLLSLSPKISSSFFNCNLIIRDISTTKNKRQNSIARLKICIVSRTYTGYIHTHPVHLYLLTIKALFCDIIWRKVFILICTADLAVHIQECIKHDGFQETSPNLANKLPFQEKERERERVERRTRREETDAHWILFCLANRNRRAAERLI